MDPRLANQTFPFMLTASHQAEAAMRSAVRADALWSAQDAARYDKAVSDFLHAADELTEAARQVRAKRSTFDREPAPAMRRVAA